MLRRRHHWLLIVAALGLLGGAGGPAQAEEGVAVATNRVMAGIYAPHQWFTTQHLTDVGNASLKKVSIGGIWFDVGDRPDNIVYLLEQVWAAGATPFVNIHVGVTADVLAAGGIDHLISGLGVAVQSWLAKGEGRSVMLAPMPEMNGDWIPYGKTPQSFKAAYLRFVSIATEAGHPFERVRWVFAPNGWSSPPYHMADYYPGADVVDLVGISAYNWGTDQPGGVWTSVAETMGGALDEARAFAGEKPFLVSQTGSSTSGGDRDQWIRDLFTYLAQDPNAVGFIYFDIDKEEDWSIYSDGIVNPGWRDGMKLSTTAYEWPLSDWFAPGPLVVDTYVPPFDGTFWDDDSSPFEADIEWLNDAGIATGCALQQFCPLAPLLRGQIAAFLSRALTLPPSTGDYFLDDSGSPYESSANQVSEAGIAQGCSVLSFCPNAIATREQVASFLVRALALAPTELDYFIDDEGSVHEGDINALRFAGITTGCDATSFCPSQVVTREQMAALLHRALAPAT
jgi:hypothetical protein